MKSALLSMFGLDQPPSSDAILPLYDEPFDEEDPPSEDDESEEAVEMTPEFINEEMSTMCKNLRTELRRAELYRNDLHYDMFPVDVIDKCGQIIQRVWWIPVGHAVLITMERRVPLDIFGTRWGDVAVVDDESLEQQLDIIIAACAKIGEVFARDAAPAAQPREQPKEEEEKKKDE